MYLNGRSQTQYLIITHFYNGQERGEQVLVQRDNLVQLLRYDTKCSSSLPDIFQLHDVTIDTKTGRSYLIGYGLVYS